MGFSNFVHRLDSKELDDKNMTFRNLGLFPSSGEGHHPYSKELEDKNMTFWKLDLSPSSSFRNIVFLSSNSLESGRWTKPH
jgi:hypothetical protein